MTEFHLNSLFWSVKKETKGNHKLPLQEMAFFFFEPFGLVPFSWVFWDHKIRRFVIQIGSQASPEKSLAAERLATELSAVTRGQLTRARRLTYRLATPLEKGYHVFVLGADADAGESMRGRTAQGKIGNTMVHWPRGGGGGFRLAVGATPAF